jgi:hypothetical protein
MANGYGLDDEGVKSSYLSSQEFSLLHVVQTGSGAHPASHPMGMGGSFSGGPSSQGVKLTTHIKLVPRSSIHPLPIRLHGVLLD